MPKGKVEAYPTLLVVPPRALTPRAPKPRWRSGLAAAERPA